LFLRDFPSKQAHEVGTISNLTTTLWMGPVGNPEGGDLYLSLALQPAWRWSKDFPARSRKIPGTRPNP
jgi:hypothetical protein